MVRFVISVAVVAAFALVVSATAALTPLAYRNQARATCAAARSSLRSAATSAARKGGLTGYLEKTLPIGERYLSRIRELTPPASLTMPHRRLVATIAAEIARLRVDLARLRAGA